MQIIIQNRTFFGLELYSVAKSTNTYIITVIVSHHTEKGYKLCGLDLRSSKA